MITVESIVMRKIGRKTLFSKKDKWYIYRLHDTLNLGLPQKDIVVEYHWTMPDNDQRWFSYKWIIDDPVSLYIDGIDETQNLKISSFNRCKLITFDEQGRVK